MAPLSRDGDSEVAARRSEHHLTWLIWLLGVLAFYPLSTGHVIRIWRGLGLAEQPISILYAPLIAASRASPVIDGFSIGTSKTSGASASSRKLHRNDGSKRTIRIGLRMSHGFLTGGAVASGGRLYRFPSGFDIPGRSH